MRAKAHRNTVEHIVFAASKDRGPDLACERNDWIVVRVRRCRNHYLVDSPNTAKAFDEDLQQWEATSAQQHLTGQPGRCHSSFDHSDHAALTDRHAEEP
jgi:hypothetical protein